MRGIALRPDGLACAESEAAPPNSPSHSSPSFFRSRSFLDLTTKQPFLVLIPALLLFLISFFRSLLYSVLLFHFIAFAWLDNFCSAFPSANWPFPFSLTAALSFSGVVLSIPHSTHEHPPWIVFPDLIATGYPRSWLECSTAVHRFYRHGSQSSS